MRIGITERGDAAIHCNEVKSKLGTVDGAILITKDPARLIRSYGLDNLKYHRVIVHCSITGYGNSMLEPGVEPKEHSIIAYQEIEAELGPLRTVLRVDPIIPTEKGMYVAEEVLSHAKGRVRVSFLDLYDHVRTRFNAVDPRLVVALNKVYDGELHASLAVRQQRLHQIEEWLHSKVEVCGEPGLECTGCISALDMQALGFSGVVDSSSTSKQRGACNCLAAKTELLDHRGRCGHGCLYCYWR